MKVDVFFEGGGILGICFIGAYKALTDYGIQIDKTIGISSGSIISSLIASRFSANEIIALLSSYSDFGFLKQKTKVAHKNYIGKPLSLLINKGIYDSSVIENFVEQTLLTKCVSSFKQMYFMGESKLKIIATDFTNKRLLLLPDDLPLYGYDPYEFKIAKAVRMSCAIPFFYTPYELKTQKGTNYIVDGGVIRNIPTTIINCDRKLSKLTLRFKFRREKNKWGKFFDDIKKPFNIYSPDCNERIIVITTDRKIKATDFDISKEELIYLYKQGYRACLNFIKSEIRQ